MKTIQNLISPVVAMALTICTILLSPASTFAGKAQPRPFTGQWCFNEGWSEGGTMAVSSRGSVRGQYGAVLGANYTISGSISDTGEVNLIYQASGMKRRGSTKTTVTGQATLQDADTLVLELHFSDGSTITQVWWRCES